MTVAPQITGDYWAHQPRGWRDVLRCTRGGHRTAMSGLVNYFTRVDRCTCGAIRIDGGFWAEGNPRRRVSPEESARLLSEAREQKEQLERTLSEATEMWRAWTEGRQS